MKKQAGRKAMIILSDGVDTGSKVSLSSCVEAAQRSDTLVYSILFEDPEAYNNGNMGGFGGRGMGRRGGGRMPVPVGSNHPDGRKVLEQISRETGGRFFRVTKKEPLSKIYSEIDEDLRSQYSIGYTPDTPSDRGVFRHIHLTTTRKNLVVTTREGYYAA
jgi:VWFA-related protein